MNEFDDPRFDSSGNPIATGVTESVVYGVDSEGEEIETVTNTWQTVYLPSGTKIKRAILQIHDADNTNYDLETGNSPFLFRGVGDTAFIRVDYPGRTFDIALEEGSVLGQINAETSGYKVAILSLS